MSDEPIPNPDYVEPWHPFFWPTPIPYTMFVRLVAGGCLKGSGFDFREEPVVESKFVLTHQGERATYKLLEGYNAIKLVSVEKI